MYRRRTKGGQGSCQVTLITTLAHAKGSRSWGSGLSHWKITVAKVLYEAIWNRSHPANIAYT